MASSYLGRTKNKENTLENFYNSNIENNMNKIEQNQSRNLINEPAFYKQFDSLKFNQDIDEIIDETVIINNSNMVHSNMTPFTSRRDLYENFTNNSQKYERLSGNDTVWKNKKEVESIFEPMKNLTNPNGMAVMTDELQGRYIPSNKNNYGNLPFQTDVKVLPGIGGSESAPYAVTRIIPRSVDDLRSEINKKVSYESKPLETIKKGELRPVDFNISHYKVPTFRENNIDNFVKNAGLVNSTKVTGEFAHVDSQRGNNENLYMGPAIDSRQGKHMGTENILFTDSKKENYLNDFTHSINAVNSRPVFLNTESYTAYENQRLTSTAQVQASGINMNGAGSYHIDRKDLANQTIKEQNINGNTMLGANGTSELKSYMFSNDSVLPLTLRDTRNTDATNIVPTQQQIYVNNLDEAKYTIKQSTINKPDIANVVSIQQQQYANNQDDAKYTVRQSTINKPDIANVVSIQQQQYANNQDEAKYTIKQSTINKPDIANVSSIQQQQYANNQDNAKNTIRQNTGNTNYIGNTGSNVQDLYSSLQDNAKNTIRQGTGYTNYTGNTGSNVQDLYSSLQDNAKNTIRQGTGNTNHIGNTGSNAIQDNYSSLQDNAKNTIRQNTGNTNYTGSTSIAVSDMYSSLQDEAKNTIRQNTGNTNYTGTTSTNVTDSYSTLQDIAKNTIKQSTIIKPINTSMTTQVKAVYSKNDEIARATIKETILHEGRGNVGDSNQGHKIIDLEDKARVTIKQSTLITNHIGAANNDIKKARSHLAENNMTIDEKREITSMSNRTANPKSDTIRGDINKDNVKLNNKRMVYGYVSGPSKPLDNNITPLSKNYTDKKTSLNDNNFYRIDPIYIDTLNSNPLVNDIYHQSNKN